MPTFLVHSGYSLPVNKKNVDSFALEQPIKFLSVIIAAYNEASTIAQTLVRLRKVLETLNCSSEIIVVESNSTDDTREILRSIEHKLDLKLLFQDHPQGKGSAVRLGMNQMIGDVFLIYDADAEYDPMDIPKLLVPIENGETSFVLGTRHEKGRSMRVMDNHRIRPALMNLAHKFFTELINVTFFVKLTDPFTMYKIFRCEVFFGVKFVSNRFDFDWELVCKAIRLGCVPIEIPVFYKSRSFSEGKKVRFIKDPLSWLVALVRFRFSKIVRAN
jgi:glycosyltransferase involved in cell wall biosynthesis